jgi:hypothetical protein
MSEKRGIKLSQEKYGSLMLNHNGEKGIPIASKKRSFVLIKYCDVEFLARASHHIYKPAFLNATDLSSKS